LGASLSRLASRRALGVVLAFTMIGATMGVVAAAVVSNPGPFTGCLGKNGDINKVAISATAPKSACGKDQTQVIFSNGSGGGVGPTGATGASGPTGATGADGADGAAVDPCAAIAGTYLQTGTTTGFDQFGNPVGDPFKYGRILSLTAGGGVSVVNADTAPAFGTPPITETQSAGQGTWECDGNDVSIRVLDLYRHDDASDHIFEVDRIDWTATFAAGPPAVLTGHLDYCSWSIPVDLTKVQTVGSPCTGGVDDVTFAITRPISMTRITLP